MYPFQQPDTYIVTDCRSKLCNVSIVSNKALSKIGIVVLLRPVNVVERQSLSICETIIFAGFYRNLRQLSARNLLSVSVPLVFFDPPENDCAQNLLLIQS